MAQVQSEHAELCHLYHSNERLSCAIYFQSGVSSGNQGKFPWTAQVYDLWRFPDSRNIHGSILKIQDKKSPLRQKLNPTNAIGCLLLQRVQYIPVNFTMRPSHVQGKHPDLQKAWFVEVWPHVCEKENTTKRTGWIEAWWMCFSFWLSIYDSWFAWEYGRIHWPCTLA